MPSLRFPVDVNLESTELGQTLLRQTRDRRDFIKHASLLSIPTALAAGSVLAQSSTPASDSHMGTGTGDSTPIPGTPTEWTPYDPNLPAVEPGPKAFTIIARDETVYVGKDIAYAGWTFNGTIPGPILHAIEGDEVTITVQNEGVISHSVDLHSAKTPTSNYKEVKPGEEWKWSFTATTPGAFMYHCGTPPVLMHIGAGMYGAMIVRPKEDWSPAQEFVFVQSEFYFDDPEADVKVPGMAKMMLASGAMMDLVTFNGYANQYIDHPITVKAGQPIRIFVVNAGPNVWSSFHVVGAIFDKAYVNANPFNELHGLQSITIGPGDGACVEFTPEVPGNYVAVNHAFGHAAHGAMAMFTAE